MGYKALITLDLPNSNNTIRNEFYNFLEEHNWYKIDSLTTAWIVNFNEETKRENALKTLRTRLKTAKEISKASEVKYAIQLAKASVIINYIN
ncbi:MAG: hypothetical protein PF481_06915 [Bacteroidales bacterium]|jgi:5'-deoxynucleotidase YfbR-like HD superfamily hydrolase|nr:hypothetical protein [Bacteroidales bacterium]